MQQLSFLIVGIAILVAILAVFRSRLLFELQVVSTLIFGSSRPGIGLYVLVMLPGTIVHELSHWLVAEILRVPTGEISIFPSGDKGDGRQKNLGSVATATTDPFRGLLIGAAPFIVGTLILVALSAFIRSSYGISPWWQIALAVYGLMVMGNSMLVSEADRHNWPIAIGVIVVIFIILWQIGLRPTAELINTLTSALVILAQVLGLTAALNLGTIGVCFLVRRSVEKISNKQVIRH